MIALHALTFPSSEGFAVGGTSAAGGGQTFFRLLPAVFRDLWDELEEKRKAEHDTINRATWAKLQSILDTKLRKDKNVGVPHSHALWLITSSAGQGKVFIWCCVDPRAIESPLRSPSGSGSRAAHRRLCSAV
jgi:hypothetical protein